MSEDWDDSETVPADAAEAAVWAAKRRARLSERFVGERVVIPSGTYTVRSNDQDYRFRPHSDYVWATGDQLSDGVLVLEPRGTAGHDAVLYMRPRVGRSASDEFWQDHRYGELWAGRRPSLAEAAAHLAVETRHRDELPAALTSNLPTRVRRGVDPSVDAMISTPGDGFTDKELAAVLSELRLVKDAYELEQLRLAVQITERGFADIVRELDAATRFGERWIEAVFWRRARLEGNDVGYHSIVGSGPHATTLHWNSNDGDVRFGDLLLLDLGAETRSLYTADITRTLPVAGTFTTLQADLYSVVYAAQSAAMEHVRPGRRFRDFHNAAMGVLAHGLEELKLLPCSAEEALDENSSIYRRWTLCGSGHMLGLDVHDCTKARQSTYLDGVLEPGHVLTVEPGLYFQASDLKLPEEMRGIGIRIEDDLVVTDHGHKILSTGLPRSPQEVQSWMSSLAEGS